MLLNLKSLVLRFFYWSFVCSDSTNPEVGWGLGARPSHPCVSSSVLGLSPLLTNTGSFPLLLCGVWGCITYRWGFKPAVGLGLGGVVWFGCASLVQGGYQLVIEGLAEREEGGKRLHIGMPSLELVVKYKYSNESTFLHLLLDAFPTFVQKVCRAASLNILQGAGGHSSVCPSFSLAAINKENPTAGSTGSGARLLMCKVIIYTARLCSSKGRGKSPGSCAALQEPWSCAGQCPRPAPPSWHRRFFLLYLHLMCYG